MTRTALYRHLDADGALLYVGISRCPLCRTKEHEETTDWYHHIASVKIDWFDSRDDAVIAEVAAIKSEQPLFNYQHTHRALRPDEGRSDIMAAATAKGGGVSALATALGVSRQAVSQWSRCPPSQVRMIEKLTGVTRYELRPDIYGSAP